jgi:hypothetical protein
MWFALNGPILKQIFLVCQLYLIILNTSFESLFHDGETANLQGLKAE